MCIVKKKKKKNFRTEDERIVRLEKELTLTELSLRENPKSYYVWNQRVWILEQLPKPNYKRELELCNKCLNLDERNCKSFKNDVYL